MFRRKPATQEAKESPVPAPHTGTQVQRVELGSVRLDDMLIDKTVRSTKQESSGILYIPKSWIGERVIIVRESRS